MKYCFGVDIGGTTVKMGLFEATGTILEKWEIKPHTEEEGKAILPDVAASLKEKKAEHDLADADIIGVGVGVPAPVTEEGIVFGSANLGWKYRKPRSRRRDRASSSKSSRNRKLRMWRKGMPGAVCICNWDCASCKKKTGAGDKKHDFKQE